MQKFFVAVFDRPFELEVEGTVERKAGSPLRLILTKRLFLPGPAAMEKKSTTSIFSAPKWQAVLLRFSILPG